MKKRILVLFMSVAVLVISVVPLTTFAAAPTITDNLISYQWLMWFFPKSEITTPSPGVIKVHLPFDNPNATYSKVFYVSYLCTFAGFEYSAGMYSFVNMPGYFSCTQFGDDIGRCIDLNSQTTIYFNYTLDQNCCLTFVYPGVVFGELGNVGFTLSTWPGFLDYHLIPTGYVHESDPTYEDGYELGYTTGKNEGYDEGFSAGVASVPKDEEYDKGYTDGYAAGSQAVSDELGLLANDFWRAAKYTLYYSYSGTIELQLEITPTFIEGGLIFPNFREILFDIRPGEDPDHEEVDYYYIVIEIPDASAFNYDKTAIFISGAFPVTNVRFATVDSRTYSGGSLLTSSGDRLTIASSCPRNLIINRLVLDFGGMSISDERDRSFSLYSSDTVFSRGYTAGYADAFADNGGKFTEVAYNKGYQTGYDKGFSEGNVVAQEGNFASLIYAVVEAPFNTFSSLFNFDLLGVNMLSFVKSLLTLAVVLFVVKKVVL